MYLSWIFVLIYDCLFLYLKLIWFKKKNVLEGNIIGLYCVIRMIEF